MVKIARKLFLGWKFIPFQISTNKCDGNFEERPVQAFASVMKPCLCFRVTRKDQICARRLTVWQTRISFGGLSTWRMITATACPLSTFSWCGGSSHLEEKCEAPCPKDCQMSPWGEWGLCDSVCGPGLKNRSSQVRCLAQSGPRAPDFKRATDRRPTLKKRVAR